MATLEDAINARIRYKRFQAGLDSQAPDPRYGVNTAFRRGCEIEIRIMKDTPRDIKVVERLLNQKKVAFKQAKTIEEHERLRCEISGLEWMRFIVKSGPKEWHAWSLLR
jgi:hypothetical protein